MKVLVLTGAGISAESGISTFRGSDGLWEGHKPQEVATPEAFADNPALVHRFYNDRRRQIQQATVRPNAAHQALALLETALGEDFLLVTQNVDNLHQRAGNSRVIAMHGELLKVRCNETGEIFDWHEDLTEGTPHPNNPLIQKSLRPHIVWFGETPFYLPQIEDAARQADVFISVGTSGTVYPAAGILSQTQSHCRTIEINPFPTPLSPKFDETIRQKASIAVPIVTQQIQDQSIIRG